MSSIVRRGVFPEDRRPAAPSRLPTAWPRAAIGTDTGGSLRIPSALNGLVGFKPTQSRVSRDGVMPLSTSFDSAGALGRTVADCALLDSIVADQKLEPSAPLTAKQLRLAVPQTFFLNELSPDVAKAFAAALSKLSAAGSKDCQKFR